MKVNSIVILNFHWDLLYIVDMSECEKGSIWEVSVPKTSAAAIFSGDLYIFAKYAPVFSNRAFPTTFASHRHCHVRTYVQMRSFNFCSFSGARCQLIGNTGFDHTPARVDGASMNPEGFSSMSADLFDKLVFAMWAGKMYQLVSRCQSRVALCAMWANKWTCHGVTSWECASTWTLLPHPTPPLRDVTHLQRSMTYVRTCKWTCRGLTLWECASTWTLLPHPTPPYPTPPQGNL